MLKEAKEWYQNLNKEKTVNALRDGGFEVTSIPNKKDAVSEILDMISSGDLVGLGGSVTLRELDLPKKLEDLEIEVANHWQARREGASYKEIKRLRRKHLNSDIFITSTNAITKTGKLVNIDGAGQRVAAMIFGPKKVIVVSGLNKIVEDVDEGLKRVKNVAAPMNAKRLNMNTPCTKTGECVDCDSEERICNITTIIHRKPIQTDVKVILVEEELGY